MLRASSPAPASTSMAAITWLDLTLGRAWPRTLPAPRLRPGIAPWDCAQGLRPRIASQDCASGFCARIAPRLCYDEARQVRPDPCKRGLRGGGIGPLLAHKPRAETNNGE